MIKSTDTPAAHMARFIQGHDPVERGDKVANDIGSLMWRELKATKEGQKVRWKWQITATFHCENCLQRCQSVHIRDTHKSAPVASKNSTRKDELLSYSPRQTDVRVSERDSRTPRISLQRCSASR